MNKFLVMLVPMSLVIWMGTTVLFLNTSREAYAEFEEQKLDLVVNYATDAAVDEMVQMTTDLGLDYAEYEYSKINPETAYNMYATIMCKGMDLPVTDANMDLVKTRYTPAFCVATYDGYYIAQPLVDKISSDYGTSYKGIFSIKQPYLYVNPAGKLFGLNLGLEECRTLDGAVVDYEKPDIPKTQQLEIINANVSDSIMKTVWEQQVGNMAHSIYIPSSMSELKKTNPIKNITVMAYVANIPIGWGKSYDTFGIGGSKITHERYVVCYHKNGQPMYTYSDAKGVKKDDIEKVFDNAIKAAEAGYYFDYDYFKGD